VVEKKKRGRMLRVRHVVDVHLRHKVGVGTLYQKQLSLSTKDGEPTKGVLQQQESQGQEMKYLDARI